MEKERAGQMTGPLALWLTGRDQSSSPSLSDDELLFELEDELLLELEEELLFEFDEELEFELLELFEFELLLLLLLELLLLFERVRSSLPL
jgi:hypothetical protein